MAKYFRRSDGQTFWAFVPAISNPAAPTSAEINAGTNLTLRICDISGFTYKNKPIETPDLASAFVSTIPGEDQADDSELTFYDDSASMALWTALAKGTGGYMVISPYAKATASKCRVWQVVSTGPNDELKLDATAAKFMVGFSVASRPNLDAVFPAGVSI